MVEMMAKEAIPVKKHEQMNKQVTMTIANAGDDEEDGNYEFTVDEAKGKIKMNNLDLNNIRGAIDTSGLLLNDKIESVL
jgi:hypothetical protein